MRIADAHPVSVRNNDEATLADNRWRQPHLQEGRDHNPASTLFPDARNRLEAANGRMHNLESTAGPSGRPYNITTPNRRGLQASSLRKRVWDDYASEANPAPNRRKKR